MATMIGAAYLELTARNEKLKAKLRESGVMSNKTVDAMQSRWEKFGRAAFIGAIAGLTAVAAAMTKATMAAAAEQVQTVQLHHQMNRLGATTEAQRQQVEALANEMQKFTRFGDTQTRKTLQDLMTLSNDFEGSMKNLELVFDIAESGMFDVNTAARYVGQAMTGNVEILGRYIPELKTSNNEQLKTMTSAEKAAYALDLLRQKFSGLARMVGDTTAGAWAKLTNAISDLWEALGKGMLEQTNKNLGDLVNTLKQIEPEAQKVGSALAKVFDVSAKAAAGFVQMVEHAAESLQRWFMPQTYRERKEAELALHNQLLIQKEVEARARLDQIEREFDLESEKRREQALREYEQWLKDKQAAIDKYQARQLRAAGFERAAQIQELKNQQAEEVANFKGSRMALEQLEKTHLMEMQALHKKFADEDRKTQHEKFMKQAEESHKETVKRIRQLISEKYGTKFSQVPAELQKYLLPETDETKAKFLRMTEDLESIYIQFLRNIGLAREADLRDSERQWDALAEKYKDSIDALKLIDAARAADRKRIEEEHRKEVAKTQREAFRPEWVGAQQLWKRAAVLGAPKEPEVKVVVERKPTREEEEQVKVLEDILKENRLQTAKLSEYGKLQ